MRNGPALGRATLRHHGFSVPEVHSLTKDTHQSRFAPVNARVAQEFPVRGTGSLCTTVFALSENQATSVQGKLWSPRLVWLRRIRGLMEPSKPGGIGDR